MWQIACWQETPPAVPATPACTSAARVGPATSPASPTWPLVSRWRSATMSAAIAPQSGVRQVGNLPVNRVSTCAKSLSGLGSSVASSCRTDAVVMPTLSGQQVQQAVTVQV
jgi:hypothetical protein